MKNFKFKRFTKILTAVSLITALSIPAFGNGASAASENENVNPLAKFEASVDNFESTTSEVNSDVKEKLLNITQENVDSTLKSLNKDELDYNKSTVTKLEDNNYFVQFHVKDSTSYEGITGISFILNKDYKILSTTELNLKLVDENNASLKVWTDGKQSINQNIEKPDVQPQWSWSVFKKCVTSDLGVSWAVAGSIGVICAGACVGTGGAACAPCIYAAASLTGANWGWCIGKAGKK